MDTKELEANIRRMEQAIRSLGQSILNMRQSIERCYREAAMAEKRAESILARASYEEDPSYVTAMYEKASLYMNQSASYMQQAENMQSQVDAMVPQLRGYIPIYREYMQEGQNNLADLNIGAEHLMKLSSQQYGATKIKEALQMTRHRITYNQNLVKGCSDRIRWIEQICGSSGDSYVKVKRR